MLKRRQAAKPAGFSDIALKGLKGARVRPPQKGLRLNALMEFMNMSQSNISMQMCYLSLLKGMVSGMGNDALGKDVRRKLTSIEELTSKQYGLMESIKKRIRGSGQDEF